MSNLSSIKNGSSTNVKVLEQFIFHSNEDLIKEVFGSSSQLDTAAIFDSDVIDILRSNEMTESAALDVVVPPQPVSLLEIRCTNDQRHSKAEPYILGSKNHSGNSKAIVGSLAHFDPLRNIRSGKNMLAMKKLCAGPNMVVCCVDDKSYEDDTVELLNAFKKRGEKLLRRLDLELEIIKQKKEELAAREQKILQERELINTFSFINS